VLRSPKASATWKATAPTETAEAAALFRETFAQVDRALPSSDFNLD
jgi:hypothetical protein